MDEIRVLEEAKGIGLPNFLPRTAFLAILQGKVKSISSQPVGFIEDVWDYLEEVVINVLMYHSDNYLQLQSSMRRAAHNLIEKMKDMSYAKVREMVAMEKLTDYTCNPDYLTEWNNLMALQDNFIKEVLQEEREKVELGNFGAIEVAHLRMFAPVLQQAIDLTLRMTAYWKIVLRRLVDFMALHLLFSVNNLVNKDMDTEILNELMGPRSGGIERILEESPALAVKRKKLTSSIKMLREAKAVVANIMDRIAANGDQVD